MTIFSNFSVLKLHASKLKTLTSELTINEN